MKRNPDPIKYDLSIILQMHRAAKNFCIRYEYFNHTDDFAQFVAMEIFERGRLIRIRHFWWSYCEIEFGSTQSLMGRAKRKAKQVEYNPRFHGGSLGSYDQLAIEATENQLREWFEILTPAEQTIFTSRFIDDETNEESSKRANISVTSVSHTIARIIRKIKAHERFKKISCQN